MGKKVRRSVDRQVRALAIQFERFRQNHQPGTKIPDELRRGALAALANGVPEAEVRAACGVSTNQLEYWQRAQETAREDRQAPAEEQQQESAEVFSVVEPQASEHTGLELRLGAWSVTVRLAGPAEG